MTDQHTAEALAAMGQETRYAALRLLVEAGVAGLAAGDLARRLNVAPSNMTFHLSTLAQAGLTTSERRGQSIIHKAMPDALKAILTTLRSDFGVAGVRTDPTEPSKPA